MVVSVDSKDESIVQVARAFGPEIYARREEIEQSRRLPPDLVEAMADQGLFRLLVPRSLGGLEVHPLTAFRVFEELARIDGSSGWVVMVGNNGDFFTGFLDEKASREVCSSPSNAPIGSMFVPNGQAIPVEGGYRVSGRWSYASGIEHSAWMVMSCTVHNEDTSSPPEVRNVFLPAHEWDVIDTWMVSGLRGTGSHDYVVRDALVPIERTYVLGDPPVQHGLAYCLPLRGIVAAWNASVPLGIARGAIDALVKMAGAKVPVGSRSLLRERVMVQVQVAQAEALIRSARAFLVEAVTQASDDVAAGRVARPERAAVLRLAATHATLSAAQAVDLMYHAGGSSAIYTRYMLERAFRDVHAVTQHALVGPSWYESIGRFFLGMEPGAPL